MACCLIGNCLNFSLASLVFLRFAEHIGALLEVFKTDPRPDLASNGEGVSPTLLHLRSLRLLPRWRPLYCGRHFTDSLH